MTEKEKMLCGLPYDCSDDELVARSSKAYSLCLKYNALNKNDPERAKILKELCPHLGKGSFFAGPVFFDYGENIHAGDFVFANYNFVVMDCAPVYLGKQVFIGPNVTLATPVHPLRYQERNMRVKEDGTVYDYEMAKEIHIGDNVWLASNVVVCGGVRIGSGSVIGAGSVVTHDIPENVLAAGNPCRVIRPITESDRVLPEE